MRHLFPYEMHDKFPNRCPRENCGVRLKRDWALGVMPQMFNQVTVVMRCPECGLVFGFMMAAGMVREYIDALDLDPKRGRLGDTFPRQPLADVEGTALADILRTNPLAMLRKFRRMEELGRDHGDTKPDDV